MQEGNSLVSHNHRATVLNHRPCKEEGETVGWWEEKKETWVE